MKKEDIALIAQLLSSMKEAVIHLEEAEKKKDIERMGEAKRAIIEFQMEISKLI